MKEKGWMGRRSVIQIENGVETDCDISSINELKENEKTKQLNKRSLSVKKGD